MTLEFKSELSRLEVETREKKDFNCFQRTKDMQWLDSHVEDGGMMRCLANIREEAAREKEFQERTDHAALVNERAQKESALCFEINAIKEEKLCEELRRQQLRDNDPELKELMRKLRASYVCRDQKQQILHGEYKRLQGKQEELSANHRLQESLYNEQQQRERQEQHQRQHQQQYRAELQQQIVNTYRTRQCQYEEKLIEKKMIDDVMRTVHEEDLRELQRKREQAERLRYEQRVHCAAQLAWRDKHKQAVYAEQRRLERQAAETANREAAIVAERKRKLELKEAVNKRVVAVILDEEAKKEERNNLIMSLQEQEYIEKGINDAKAEKEKIARAKLQNKMSLNAQIEMRKEQAAREREGDRRFRLDTERQMRKEEQKQQQQCAGQRERQAQYTRELREQMAADETRRRQERQAQLERPLHVREADTHRQQQIAAERERLIEEHVPHLLGYLQPGTIQKSDLPVIRRGANRHPDLAGLDIEAVGKSRPPQRFAKCNEQCRVLREY